MNRAYSLLEIKAVDEDAREITGLATTPEVDRVGDIVEPDGAEFKLPIPLLWQHHSDQPIGHVTEAKVSKNGITIKAKLVKVTEDGALKDRIDEAWQSIKLRLVRGLSIGFKSIEMSFIEDGNGIRFMRWLWLELSAVTIPANQGASIQTVKSIDAELLAAAGQDEQGDDDDAAGDAGQSGDADETKTPPGVSGSRRPQRVVHLEEKEERKPFVIREIIRIPQNGESI